MTLTRGQRDYQKNREKIKAKSRAYRAANYEAVKARMRARTTTPQYRQNRRLKLYGLTFDTLFCMLADQEMGCAICRAGLDKGYAVDHDHATGRVRGLLCQQCNVALGMMNDDPVCLENAATYLRRTK